MAPHLEAFGKNKKSKLPIERPGIIAENPEKHYTFGETLGTGKFSIVKRVTDKLNGKVYAAKIIKYDDVTVRYAIREYDLMNDKLKPLADNKCLPQLHQAYLVRKYLILVMTLCEGKSLLEYFAARHSITEEDLAIFVKGLCTVLAQLHSKNIVHLDIRPTNIRLTSNQPHDLKLLDYNSARHIPNKKAGAVVDVIGDTEFCAPEMLSFDRVQPGSDMWSVAVIMFILLSGVSPFYYEDEAKVSSSVERVQYNIKTLDETDAITPEAKDFIKKILIRAPEMRMTAEKALEHKWLSEDYTTLRKRSIITVQDVITKTDMRLLGEEEEDYVNASCIFKTFDEEEHVSTESDDEDDEEED